MFLLHCIKKKYNVFLFKLSERLAPDSLHQSQVKTTCSKPLKDFYIYSYCLSRKKTHTKNKINNSPSKID